MKIIAAAVAAAFALAPLAAQAQTPSSSYRCTGKDGKKYYGSSVPEACLGQPVEQLNTQGMVIKRFDAQASAAEREKKAAEEADSKKREALSKEEGRRNRALLATYTNEKDIEKRIGGLKTRLDELKKELDFYSGKNKPPAKLATDIRNTEFDVTTQEDLMAAKKKEVDQINTRYDDDKKRYLELTKGAAPAAGAKK